MKLDLYKFDACPYCQRVMKVIEASGRTDIEYHDTRTSEEDRLYLIERGGKEQVPCLFIDGSPLYESMDIIAWLEEHPQELEVK